MEMYMDMHISNMYVDLVLNHLFPFFDLYVCHFTSATLSWLLWFYGKS